MKIENLLLLIILGCLASCSKNASDLEVLNLEGEFVINADQRFTENGSAFSYYITTANDQECQSSEIVYRLLDVEGELNLILEDITQIENCPSDAGKVEAYIPVSIVEGKTDVSISLRNVVKNKGTLESTATQYKLDLPNSEGIIIGNSVVNKMPEDVLFGVVTGVNLQDPVMQNLLDSLDQFNQGSLTDGYYTSYFSVSDGEANFLDDTPTPAEHKDVYYRLENKEAFIDFIRAYKENHNIFGFRLRDSANGELILI